MHGRPLSWEEFSIIQEAGEPLLRGLAILVAAILGGWMFRRGAMKWPLDKGQKFEFMLVVFVGSLVGAALPSIFAGGLIGELTAHGLVFGPNTIIGALVAGFLAAAVYKKQKGIYCETADDFVLGTALAMCIGRVGCHFGHCCVGRVSDIFFASDFGDGVDRLPSQLIEAAGMLGLFAFFYWLERKRAFSGRRLFLFMMGYGLVRFLMEFIRAPIAAQYMGIGSYQWFALALFVLGGFQFFRRANSLGFTSSEG